MLTCVSVVSANLVYIRQFCSSLKSVGLEISICPTDITFANYADIAYSQLLKLYMPIMRQVLSLFNQNVRTEANLLLQCKHVLLVALAVIKMVGKLSNTFDGIRNKGAKI